VELLNKYATYVYWAAWRNTAFLHLNLFHNIRISKNEIKQE
jgi:hypothetical protein